MPCCKLSVTLLSRRADNGSGLHGRASAARGSRDRRQQRRRRSALQPRKLRGESTDCPRRTGRTLALTSCCSAAAVLGRQPRVAQPAGSPALESVITRDSRQPHDIITARKRVHQPYLRHGRTPLLLPVVFAVAAVQSSLRQSRQRSGQHAASDGCSRLRRIIMIRKACWAQQRALKLSSQVLFQLQCLKHLRVMAMTSRIRLSHRGSGSVRHRPARAVCGLPLERRLNSLGQDSSGSSTPSTTTGPSSSSSLSPSRSVTTCRSQPSVRCSMPLTAAACSGLAGSKHAQVQSAVLGATQQHQHPRCGMMSKHQGSSLPTGCSLGEAHLATTLRPTQLLMAARAPASPAAPASSRERRSAAHGPSARYPRTAPALPALAARAFALRATSGRTAR